MSILIQDAESLYTVIQKTWQYIYNHNSGISLWILIIFTYLETGMNDFCN